MQKIQASKFYYSHAESDSWFHYPDEDKNTYMELDPWTKEEYYKRYAIDIAYMTLVYPKKFTDAKLMVESWITQIRYQSQHHVSLHILLQPGDSEDISEEDYYKYFESLEKNDDLHIHLHHFKSELLYVSQNHLRNTLWTKVKNYVQGHFSYAVLHDDDFEFRDGSAKYYDEQIAYMDQNPSVGLIQTSGYLGGYVERERPLMRWGAHFWMDRGIIIRPISDLMIFPHDLYRPGGLFETYIYLYYTMNGYVVVTTKNNPTLHRHYFYRNKDRKEKSSTMSDELVAKHMHSQQYLDDAVVYFNSIMGKGTYKIETYAPKLKLHFKAPTRVLFNINQDAGKELFVGGNIYTLDGGKHSRGLPK